MSRYTSTTRKLEKIWFKIESIQADILISADGQRSIFDTISLSQPITSKMVGALDVSSEWVLLARDTTITGDSKRLIINFQIIFERMDIRMLPFFYTQFVYRVGNDEENEKYIDDPLFHPTNQTRLLPSGGHTNELIQEINIPTGDGDGEDSFIKRVIYNKSLVLEEALEGQLPSFQVKLNAKFLNPHVYY